MNESRPSDESAHRGFDDMADVGIPALPAVMATDWPVELAAPKPSAASCSIRLLYFDQRERIEVWRK